MIEDSNQDDESDFDDDYLLCRSSYFLSIGSIKPKAAFKSKIIDETNQLISANVN